MKKLTLLFVILPIWVFSQKRQTVVSIKNDNFYINNQITFKGKSYQGMNLEGLLPNSRMVQGIFDDTNPKTVHQWKYPDTQKWDPDRNTNEFIAAMPSWKAHGLLAFTLNLQGGSPYGYSKDQPWINSAIKADGSLDKNFMIRLDRILKRSDELGMVVILGYFYFGQDANIKDDTSIERGADNITKWLLKKNYRNILVEINNESNVRYESHPMLQPSKVAKLIERVKAIEHKDRRLLVSTSFGGGFIPTDNVLAVCDFVLLHGNGVKQPARIEEMVNIIRKNPLYKGQPIVFNEDDHFDFDKPYNNFIAATKVHASWGFFDYRMKGEKFEDGYQSIPVDWTINSVRKKGFFELLKKITNK